MVLEVQAPGKKGTALRIIVRGKMNSTLVEFEDGFKVVTSRYAVRRIDSEK